jgi:hypothetical protein
MVGYTRIIKILALAMALVLLSSCGYNDYGNNENPNPEEQLFLDKEYYDLFEGLGYQKTDNVTAVTPYSVSSDGNPPPQKYLELRYFLESLKDEQEEYYKSSSEIAIVIATKIGSETFVKDSGFIRTEEGKILRDKRVVTVTKMRIDEVPETIKTNGKSLKVGDYFCVLEYRGEYSTNDEIVYENGFPYALEPTVYRAISDGPSICFVNLDDKPITVSGYTGNDEFTGWWKCSSVSIEKRVYSENNWYYDRLIPESISKYAWHLLDK